MKDNFKIEIQDNQEEWKSINQKYNTNKKYQFGNEYGN